MRPPPRLRPRSQASPPSSQRQSRLRVSAPVPSRLQRGREPPAHIAPGSWGPGPQQSPANNRAKKKRASSALSPPGAEPSKSPGEKPHVGPGRRPHRSAA
ncbi:hypothetical protein NDU88_006491 [Pleurodeles waltl]|uniref:Uncharacterized protein n=1 Tax=Pleurodeles waltl TaxID=8319 RepID=A0AAV7RS21_PLEWA|nr:hypothetical protein NDU88_006491 [Pleurodeles waltl]